jgi:hypothetical protein
MRSYYAPSTRHNGGERSDIPSRERHPYQRQEPYIGRLLIELPGFSIDWTLRQDMRDMRRFYALDAEGARHGHAAPKELLRCVALLVPRYSVTE